MTCSRPSSIISMEIQPYMTVPVTLVFLHVHKGRSRVLQMRMMIQSIVSQLQLVDVTLRLPLPFSILQSNFSHAHWNIQPPSVITAINHTHILAAHHLVHTPLILIP